VQVGLLPPAQGRPDVPMDLVIARELAVLGSHGMAARAYPELVAGLANRGHEIACHGDRHLPVHAQTAEEFAADLRTARQTIEQLTGRSPLGYRAPAFSIQDWSIPLLEDLGFSYDSSSFPIVAHDRYGRLSGLTPGQTVVELRPGFYEVSVSCLQVGASALPWAGGGYFRLIPYPVFRRGVRRILATGEAYVFYIHPWEIDADQPRVDGIPRGYRFRHYVGLQKCERRFACLLDDFRWSPIADVIAERRLPAPVPSA
jgi:polysaccharide deacetylase family protein (PEP-CTERM system associated)